MFGLFEINKKVMLQAIDQQENIKKISKTPNNNTIQCKNLKKIINLLNSNRLVSSVVVAPFALYAYLYQYTFIIDCDQTELIHYLRNRYICIFLTLGSRHIRCSLKNFFPPYLACIWTSILITINVNRIMNHFLYFFRLKNCLSSFDFDTELL